MRNRRRSRRRENQNLWNKNVKENRTPLNYMIHVDSMARRNHWLISVTCNRISMAIHFGCYVIWRNRISVEKYHINERLPHNTDTKKKKPSTGSRIFESIPSQYQCFSQIWSNRVRIAKRKYEKENIKSIFLFSSITTVSTLL